MSNPQDEREALQRLESAVDWYLGRSAFTQTRNLKGLAHSEAVRKELYAAHDAARAALANQRAEAGVPVAYLMEPAPGAHPNLKPDVTFHQPPKKADWIITPLVRAAAQPEAVPQGGQWRDHVEQRIRTWRQRTMNKSGDMLAIDDFMGQESIDDLVDFVCDEWAAPPSTQPPAAQAMAPLTDEWIRSMCKESWVFNTVKKWVRIVEAAHGIGTAKPAQPEGGA